MCDDCDHESALELCEEILDTIDDLPERAEEFGESIREKVESIQSWIEENGHVTAAQESALANMESGVNRWLEH